MYEKEIDKLLNITWFFSKNMDIFYRNVHKFKTLRKITKTILKTVKIIKTERKSSFKYDRV